MNLATFQQRRLAALSSGPTFRKICSVCRQPDFSCFCEWLRPFDPRIDFIILTHPIEQQRRIATGRMAHLSLRNSQVIVGHDYTGSRELNRVLTDSSRHCMMLYPGRLSRNITEMSPAARATFAPKDKRLTLIVIDGTWSTARKMVHLSQNLKTVPRICFTPSAPSNFRVRQQPRAECYSTIEAIHQVLELLGGMTNRQHDGLLHVFDNMVNRQLELAHCGKPSRRRYYEPQSGVTS